MEYTQEVNGKYQSIEEQLKGIAISRLDNDSVQEFKLLVCDLSTKFNVQISKDYLKNVVGFSSVKLCRLLQRSEARISKQNSYPKIRTFGHKAVRQKDTLSFIHFD